MPIVLTSGTYEFEATPAELRDAPFFPKPCDYGQVAERIRALLDGK